MHVLVGRQHSIFCNNPKSNLNRFAMSIVRSLTYGKRAIPRDRPMMDCEQAATNSVEVLRPGAVIIEYSRGLLKMSTFLQQGGKTLLKYHDTEYHYDIEKYHETVEFHKKYPDRPNIIGEIQAMHDGSSVAALLDIQPIVGS